MDTSIDDEWASFLSNQSDTFSRSSNQLSGGLMVPSIPERVADPHIGRPPSGSIDVDNPADCSVPECEELYISTKTKVLFLNQPIDINTIFWKLPIISYSAAENGIIKKQMKVVSTSEEEYNAYKSNLVDIEYYNEHIIKQINNANARKAKYKDERKITVGMSKKDIMNCRGKVKSAFYNCFAVILRFKFDHVFREIHVKVFNTGKLEIPGVLNARLLDVVKPMILNILSPYMDNAITYIESDTKDEDECNVLINSNFNCGYYINRDKLYSILRSSAYGIETAYDPCSYPGVKCKFYFNNELGFDHEIQRGQIVMADRDMRMCELGDNKKYTEVSFMIFRTGSCLIVGNCTERILRFVYAYIKALLKREYYEINVINSDNELREKKTKIRKKTLSMSKEYYHSITCAK
jgi:hypothetical protein